MLLMSIRALLGFLVACLVAGLTQVAFATSLPGASAIFAGDWIERIGPTVALVVFVTAQSALFAAPFALVAIVAGRWQDLGSWIYYGLAGLAIGLGGFLALRAAELPGQPTIVNAYALTAYLTAGFLAGAVYWLLAGRKG